MPNAVHHGEEKGPYTVWMTMLGVAVNFTILKWGGFSNGIRRLWRDDLARKFGWDDYEEHGGRRYAADKYDEQFCFLGWHFHFWGNDSDEAPRYGATMSRDGEIWECDYDYMFGAGFDGDV